MPNFLTPTTLATMVAVTAATMFALNMAKTTRFAGPLIKPGAIRASNVVPFTRNRVTA